LPPRASGRFPPPARPLARRQCGTSRGIAGPDHDHVKFSPAMSIPRSSPDDAGLIGEGAVLLALLLAMTALSLRARNLVPLIGFRPGAHVCRGSMKPISARQHRGADGLGHPRRSTGPKPANARRLTAGHHVAARRRQDEARDSPSSRHGSRTPLSTW
jgi:hypothetical protein